MSGHLDGPPPGPPDPPYIPGDLGAPSAEEFARRRASPEPERNPYLAVSPHEIIQERADRLARCWDEGFAAGRAALPDERLREALELIRAHARLDLTERGIAEAERYAAIADDALTARDQETER